MTIITDIANEIRRLGNSPAVKLIFSKDTLARLTESELGEGHQMIEEMYGLDCPPSVLQSLMIDDELSAHWKSEGRSPAETVVGEFFLRSVLVFAAANSLNEVFLSQHYETVDLRATRVFDYYPYQGGPIYSLLPIVENRIEDRVLIFDEKDVYRTILDYPSYLEALRRTRGFLYWQYLFCEGITPEEYQWATIQKGLDFVADTFPDDDYTDLRRRLER